MFADSAPIPADQAFDRTRTHPCANARHHNSAAGSGPQYPWPRGVIQGSHVRPSTIRVSAATPEFGEGIGTPAAITPGRQLTLLGGRLGLTLRTQQTGGVSMCQSCDVNLRVM